MKKKIIYIYVLLILVSLSACNNSKQNENMSNSKIDIEKVSNENNLENKETKSSTVDHEREKSEYMLNIKIGEHLLPATLVQNSSTEALIEMLSINPITINMQDYANMEKVGTLPESLPRNDEQINTEAGDLILYQGNSFVIYYDTNSWNFTRLGKIDNITQQELKKILGDKDVTVELSLSMNS